MNPFDTQSAWQRYSCYYMSFLQERETSLQESRQAITLGEIEAELTNIRAAWHWAAAQAETDIVESGLNSLYLFYELKGCSDWSVADFVPSLISQSDVQNAPITSRVALLNGRFLIRQGLLLGRLGQYEKSLDALQSGLRLLRQGKYSFLYEQALAHKGLGYANWGLRRLADAKAHLTMSLHYWQQTGCQQNMAQTLNFLANVACDQNRYEQAHRLYQNSMTLYKQLENSVGIAVCLNNLSHLAELSKDYALAESYLLQSLAVSRTVAAWWLTAVSFSNLAHIATLQNRPQQAISYQRLSLMQRQQHNLSME